ncbi:uncharacterized protein RCC_07948 [Ramularia collo-cygni]|uniref:Uncharacterized protein n=1 Tax=Ramularia collo-cygni TaxID=112498 RepID=A0A2D3VJ42_9PEZI|nr:uncharacterized protein RCC_07948 [Ramularia collo-cygni]CZT22079.1 uncharacterized protein RCC_07948 [Ramularia collo-cygni]
MDRNTTDEAAANNHIRNYAIDRHVEVVFTNGYKYEGQLARSYTSGDPVIHLRDVKVSDTLGAVVMTHVRSSLYTDHSEPIEDITIH